MKPKGEVIRGINIRVYSLRFILIPISEVVVIKVGTHYASYFSIRVNLVSHSSHSSDYL